MPHIPGPFALDQFPALTTSLPATAVCSDPLTAFGLFPFECIETAPNRLAIDVELVGEVSLALACANALANLPDLVIRQFGMRRHSIIVWSRDIS